jgi:hypothetical protein
MTTTVPTSEATPTRYNVVCGSCGQVFTPAAKSALWWKAKKRDEKGFLDAHQCTGEECGCVQKRYRPDAHFRVFGYTDDCRDFDIPFDTFVDAVQKYRELRRSCVLFIEGVSDKVKQELEW